MNEVFRIQDKFKIAGRGFVYILEKNKETVIHIEDILVDLCGNHFKVKGIEMFQGILDSRNIDDMPIGIMFELLDEVEVSGNILVRDLQNINFLFCNHPLYQKKVDEDYEEEFQAAGFIHSCAFFSYEDLERGKLSLYGEEISGLTIYRGWMMKPEMYENFYFLLEKEGIILINTPEEYKRYHLLPGWYVDFKEETAESVWEDKGKLDSVMEMIKIKGLEGPYIVKDYVKSRKHEWYDACFINNISDAHNTSKVIGNFIDRQGSSLIGGVVLRKFENLKQIGFHEKSGMPLSEEYRVFIYAGRILNIDDYWIDKSDIKISDEEKQWINDIAHKVKSNFVTMDIARRTDGSLVIMEFGDGQVSGLQQIDAVDFYNSFDEGYSILVEDLISDDAVIMFTDPMPGVTPEDMLEVISNINSIQQLVDAYVQVHNKFWFIENDLYDYEEGTNEYEIVRKVVEDWCEMMETLEAKVIKEAKLEGLLDEQQQDLGIIKKLEKFMSKYGYRDGCGWWVKKKE